MSEEKGLELSSGIAPLSVTQMKAGLHAVMDVMESVMKEGHDYGKIPGCGDKPCLFQPGAQKLAMMFNLSVELHDELISEYPGLHRGYRLRVRISSGNKFADGVSECSTLETKYRYRNSGKKCPECGKETIIKRKPEFGGGWICFTKKGGCGAKFANDDDQITGQQDGKVEYDNPPDYWNTCRKMAYKRAFVHATINFTNTSELWTQDIEDMADMAANGTIGSAPAAQPTAAPKQPQHYKDSVNVIDFEHLKSSPDSAKKWECWVLECEQGNGKRFKVGTFTKAMAEEFHLFKGCAADIAYHDGKKEGTFELDSITQIASNRSTMAAGASKGKKAVNTPAKASNGVSKGKEFADFILNSGYKSEHFSFLAVELGLLDNPCPLEQVPESVAVQVMLDKGGLLKHLNQAKQQIAKMEGGGK